jgi:tetraprenyl-beta-curcumene synthase
VIAPARDWIAVTTTLGAYRAAVVPSVRRRLARWRGIARGIPDPALRGLALAALEEKALNVEAVAVFATLAPRRHRADAIGAITALQIAVDYIDNLGEQEVDAPLDDGLRLHRALVAALTPGAEPIDWYRLHPHREDGGYLTGLVLACQESVRSLPSGAAVLPAAARAAARCGEGQSHSHATRRGEAGALERWARQLPCPPEYRWWEVAAGASSSVAAHALIAAAADPGQTAAGAELIDAAYFPSIGALTVLLDDLIDREADARGGEHNYLSYYSGSEAAAERLGWIAAAAEAAVAKLRHRRRHAAIVAGVAGFYLSAKEAETAYASPIRARLLDTLGPTTRPLVAVMRRRRGSTSGP